MKILNLKEIKKIISNTSEQALLNSIEDSFISFSNGAANVPPVGHLGFIDPPGDMHIKYGYIKGEPYYVVKIASGFYQNQAIGLPNNNGLMMVFDAKTGKPECLLQDEGYLTDLRTALAGAVVAKHMGPEKIKAIGIIGTGVQARMQLQMLKSITNCREVYVYGRSESKTISYKHEMSKEGYDTQVCQSPAQVASQCNLIITTTASQKPLISVTDVQPGTHITAMGADAPGKQELDPKILGKAALIACDSKSQCLHHGETHSAIKEGVIQEESIQELGEIISASFQRNNNDITVADLTGIATQDIAIASLVMSRSSL